MTNILFTPFLKYKLLTAQKQVKSTLSGVVPDTDFPEVMALTQFIKCYSHLHSLSFRASHGIVHPLKRDTELFKQRTIIIWIALIFLNNTVIYCNYTINCVQLQFTLKKCKRRLQINQLIFFYMGINISKSRREALLFWQTIAFLHHFSPLQAK